MESSTVLSSKDERPWLKQIDLGIRNRASGLNLLIEKLDEKITHLMVLREFLKDEASAKASVAEISLLKINLDTAKQMMNEILIEYKVAGYKKEDDVKVIKKLKDLIIEVYKTKCSIDLGFRVFTNNSKGDHDDEKGKGLINEDFDVKYDHYGEGSHTGTGLVSSTEEESEEGVVEFEKKDGNVMERFLGKLTQTSSSGDDRGQEVSDSEEGLDQAIRDLFADVPK